MAHARRPAPKRRSWTETFTRNEREYEFEVYGSASGAVASSGPMVRERRQHIASRGDSWYVIDEDDYEVEFRRCGRPHLDEREGIEAAVSKSTAFILDRDGYPLSLWYDDEVDGIELYDPYEDEDDDDEDEEVRRDLLDLWDTVITSAGVVLAGPGASGTLPAPGPLYAMVGTEADRKHLVRAGVWVAPATIRVRDAVSDGFIVDLPDAVVVRLAAGLNNNQAYELTQDAVRTIDCVVVEFIATALRDRP